MAWNQNQFHFLALESISSFALELESNYWLGESRERSGPKNSQENVFHYDFLNYNNMQYPCNLWDMHG